MTFAKFPKPIDFPVDYLKSNHVPGLEQDHRLRYALLLSLVLHIVGYFWLPYFKQAPLPKPTRFEVELTQLMAQAPSQPASNLAPAQPEPIQEQPQPPVPKTITKPTPAVKPRDVAPVLATESPDASVDHTVTAAPATNELPTNQVNTTPQTSAASSTHTNSETTSNESARPSENTAPSEASPDEAWDGYGQQLYDLVGKNKNYPAIAIRRNWEGTVKLLAKFVAGRLVDVTIVESSQRQPLDDEAMRMLKKAVAQIPVKGALVNKNFTVVVPVDFKLN